jgi:hypothetical protein
MLAAARPGAISLHAEGGNDLLCNIPMGTGDALVKAHALDTSLLKLLEIAGARIIVTLRSPHDSFVSQSDRFKFSSTEILRQLTSSYASLAMVPPGPNVLTLQFEDRFFARTTTMQELASFLELDISKTKLADIFASLEFSRVKEWTSDLKNQDHATQLHPTHISDCQVGKGRERLSPRQYQDLADCLAPFEKTDEWRARPIKWSSAFFSYSDGRAPREEEYLELNGDERMLLFGPYLHLPAGYWRIVPLVQTEFTDVPVSILIDVFTLRRGVMQLRMVTVPSPDAARLTLEFENIDHLDPIEMRITTVGDGNQTRLMFYGVEVHYLGPCSAQPCLRARTIVDEDF